MKVLKTVLFGVMSWVVGALFPSRQLQQLINNFQCRCVRQMMRIRRGSGELWLEWEQRSMRLARAEIWRFAGQRWGEDFVTAYWTYAGHRVREELRWVCRRGPNKLSGVAVVLVTPDITRSS